MPSAQKSGPEPKTQIRFSRFEGLRRLAAEELLHLFNEAGASRRMLVLTPFRQRRTEFLQEVLLLRGEVHRRFHVHVHVEVALHMRADVGDALAAQPQNLPGLGALRNRDTGFRVIVGTDTSPPNAAVVKLIGRSACRSSPSRWKMSWGLIMTCT